MLLTRGMRILTCLGVLILMLAPSPPEAQAPLSDGDLPSGRPLPPIMTEDGLDAGVARAAVLHGEILSLDRILEIVRREFSGDIIEIQLELEDGALAYEFDILSPDGRLFEIEMDAATGKVLELEDGSDD
jgi:hypothetical protein